MKWFRENWIKTDKGVESIKLFFFSIFMICLILFVLALLWAGFNVLFGGGAGCGYDLSC